MVADHEVNAIKRDELTGYRRPTDDEHKGIVAYLKNRLPLMTRPNTVWTAVCSVFAGAFLIGLPGFSSAAELFLRLLLLNASALALFFLIKSRRDTIARIQKIERGEYGVLDCFAWDISFSVEYASDASVKIQTASGQRCDIPFLIDSETARKCTSDKSIKLLLMRCDSLYELFTPVKLKG